MTTSQMYYHAPNGQTRALTSGGFIHGSPCGRTTASAWPSTATTATA